jgi:nitroimidazol reductase NimA-like FMN-containing flavoprotein (pyridoxamine 5'-phosphate oxidase superfamily)
MTGNNVITKQMVYDFLKNYQLMAISTYGDFPWVANLYYAVTPDLTLYFLSKPTRIHCAQIEKNPLVACSIYDSTQSPVKQQKFTKVGVQISGSARLLTDDTEITQAIDLWKKAIGLVSEDYSLNGIKQNKIEGRMYQVTPKKVRMFNEDLFEENNIPILEL